ncbi:MAG: hypothetical protein WDM71_00490 [Ferruginibacter sp.]
MQDFEALSRKSYAQGILFYQEMLRKRLKREMRVITYKTAHHNEWNIMYRIFTDSVHKLFYLRTYDKVGPVTYHIEFRSDGEMHLVKQNTHFYQRYNERMKLNLSKSTDVIKHFFKHNNDYDVGITETTENGLQLIQFVYTNGIAVGAFHIEAKMIHIKTFISNDILTNRQKTLIDFIKYHDEGEQFAQDINTKHFKNDL